MFFSKLPILVYTYLSSDNTNNIIESSLIIIIIYYAKSFRYGKYLLRSLQSFQTAHCEALNDRNRHT